MNKPFKLYVSSIHSLLLWQKYEVSSVDCTQIEDLNNLCVRPTFTCKQAKLGLDSFRFTSVEMTFKEIASIKSLTLKVNKHLKIKKKTISIAF